MNTEPVVKRETTKPVTAWYWFCRAVTHRLFFDPLGGIEAIGHLNIPPTGPVIIAPLHFSNLDPPAISGAMRRHLRFMAKEELFKGWFGRLITSVGAFPVKRGEGDTEAIRLAMAILQDGQCLLVFPEGGRGDGVTLGSINRGVAMLAKRSNAPVVPTAIVGTHIMLPKGAKKVKRHGIKVLFGEPFTFDQVATSAGGGAAGRDAFVRELETRLLAAAAEAGLPLKAPHGAPDETTADPV